MRARILGHDGQVLKHLEIRKAVPSLVFGVPPKHSLTINETADDSLIGRYVVADYEQTTDDGVRIYRVKVNIR